LMGRNGVIGLAMVRAGPAHGAHSRAQAGVRAHVPWLLQLRLVGARLSTASWRASAAVRGRYTPARPPRRLRTLAGQGRSALGPTVAIVDAYDDPSAEAIWPCVPEREACRPAHAPTCASAGQPEPAAVPLPDRNTSWGGRSRRHPDGLRRLPALQGLAVGTNAKSPSPSWPSVSDGKLLGATQISKWGGTGVLDREHLERT